MVKRIGWIILLLLLTCSFSVQSYTVIFKNGKKLEGTVISENEEVLVFKDVQGFQYSLKKKFLDIDKMKEANAPPPPPPPVEEQKVTTEAPKKEAKVYTARDLEILREKYPELGTVPTAPEEGDELLTGDTSPRGIYSQLQAVANRISGVVTQTHEYLAGMTTAFEVASSTGENAAQAVAKFREKQAGTMSAIRKDVSEVAAARDFLLQNPGQYKNAVDALSFALQKLEEGLNQIQEHDNSQNPNLLRNRVSDSFQAIEPRLIEIRSIPAPEPVRETPEEETEAEGEREGEPQL